jgi:hypothetical protein
MMHYWEPYGNKNKIEREGLGLFSQIFQGTEIMIKC